MPKKRKPKTKMIWELEPGDFGRLRDKNKTIVFAFENADSDNVCVQALTKKEIYICLPSSLEDRMEAVQDSWGIKLSDHTVDLLDITLE